jgi:hypothetical protein
MMEMSSGFPLRFPRPITAGQSPWSEPTAVELNNWGYLMPVLPYPLAGETESPKVNEKSVD